MSRLNSIWRSRLALGLAGPISTVLLSSPSLAQVQPPSGKPDTAQRDSGDIVVTAQKRTENLQNVPLAVVAVSGDAIKSRNLAGIGDLGVVSPGVTLRAYTNVISGSINVRGVGTTALTVPTVEQSVSIASDGVVLGAFPGAFFDFNDIERIEVLRGPQGTLFGKGSSNGLINIVTKLPTQDLSISAGTSYGTLNEWKTRLSVAGGLSENLAGRISFYRTTRDGLGKSILPGGGSVSVNDVNQWGLRGQLLFDPASNLRIRLSGDYSKSHSRCCVPFALIDNNAMQGPGLVHPRDNRTNFGDEAADVFSDVEGYGATLQVDYDLDDSSITSITAYRKVKSDGNSPVDLTPAPVFTTFRTNYAFRQFSQELRLASSSGNLVDYTLGLFYFNSRLTNLDKRNIAVFPTVYAQESYTDASVDNGAAFGQLTVNLSDRFRLIAGGRYTIDHQTLSFRNLLPFNALFPNPIAPFLPPPFNSDPIAPRIFQANDLDTKFTNRDFSFKLGAQYDITSDVNAYVSYTEGYKGGGFISDPGTLVDPTAATVRPEIPKSWEAGIRSQFLDRKVTLNLTLFNTRFKGLQTSSINPLTQAFILVNANARTRGFEVESQFRPTDTTTLTFNGTYADAKFLSGSPQQCYNGQTAAQGCINGLQDLTGQDLPDAPKFSFTASAHQDIPLSDGYNGYLDMSYFHRSGAQMSQGGGGPYTIQGGYGRFDATIGIKGTLGSGEFNLRGYVRNLFKANYATSIVNQPSLGTFLWQFVGYESGRRVFGVAFDWEM